MMRGIISPPSTIDYKFRPAPVLIERALATFESKIKMKQQDLRNRKRHPSMNLTHGGWNLVQHLKQHNDYVIVAGDKNLGPCILDRSVYINRGCSEHLGNKRNYKVLTREGALNRQQGLIIQLRNFISRYGPREDYREPVNYTCISKAEDTYLRRAVKKYADKLAKFRMTAKIHKNPWKMRPIVCCAGTMMNSWSKWLDYWLQKLKHLIPTYIKDSQQVLDEIKTIELPPNAKLFTCDANSMYNNIDTEHAITVISWWLKDMDEKEQLPANFPLEAVIHAMKTIMRNNIFEWGDLFFLQLIGTAMGTSAAVMWATLYYAYHEVHTLIPAHGQFLLYFKRFIDDILGIWIGNTTTEWESFRNEVDNFGILTWDIKQQKLTTSVNFLDLTLTIRGGTIISSTYQKAMNLYLYLHFASAHPQGCIKGTVHSLIRR